jgi:Putative beta-barrel porin 2
MSGGRRVLTACMLMLGMPTFALGQSGDEPERVPVRLGPVALVPTLAFSTEWDSNVFLQSNPSENPDDLTTTVTPRVEGWSRMGPARLRSQVTLGFFHFRDHPGEGSIDVNHDGRLELPLTRITPYLSWRWIDAKERFGYEIDDRVRRHEAGATVGVTVHMGARTDLGVSASRGRFDLESSPTSTSPFVSDYPNNDTQGLSLGVHHQLTPLTGFGVNVSGHRERFDDPSRDSKGLDISAGFDFTPFALVTGSAYLGWFRAEMLNSGEPPISGFAGSVDLSYTLFGATRFSIQLHRDLSFSAIRGQQAYLNGGISAAVAHRLNETWDVGARVSRNLQTYDVFETTDTGQADQEIVTNYRGDVGYRVGPDTRLGFVVSHQTRGSTFTSARGYGGSHVGVTVGYRF